MMMIHPGVAAVATNSWAFFSGRLLRDDVGQDVGLLFFFDQFLTCFWSWSRDWFRYCLWSLVTTAPLGALATKFAAASRLVF
jgi:hypothetical protein